MKRALIVILVMLFAALAWAQKNPENTPAAAQPAFSYQPTPQEAELIRLSREWMDAALVKQDEKRLRELMAPEYNLQIFDASRAPQPLAQWMEARRSRLKDIRFEYTSINARVFGNTAVVYSTFVWSGKYDGKEFQDSGLVVDVWKKKQGRWQVISRRSAGMQMLGAILKSAQAAR